MRQIIFSRATGLAAELLERREMDAHGRVADGRSGERGRTGGDRPPKL